MATQKKKRRKTQRVHTYKDAGVDADAGLKLIEHLKPLAKETHRSGVLQGVGGFSALFSLGSIQRYKEPVLVSSTDGVGTKVKIAAALNKSETIGIDLVAMVVNDILTTGAEPLFFLDYFACGKLEVEAAVKIIGGIARGCKEAGCALIGGETAEMPGVYAGTDYDLAGFGVGIVEKDQVIDGSCVSVGSKLVGIASSGLHSNGFSLVRSILGESPNVLNRTPEGLDAPLGDTLLTPTKIYTKPILSLIRSKIDLLAIAHITGGGIPGNLPRVLPESVKATIQKEAWARPEIFQFIESRGHVPEAEMWDTFNMGIGLILVVQDQEVSDVIDLIRGMNEKAWIIGEIQTREPGQAGCEIV